MIPVQILPYEIQEHICEYVWGSIELTKLKFIDVLKALPNREAVHYLRSIDSYKSYGHQWEETEDNVFCHRCGEKTVFLHLCFIVNIVIIVIKQVTVDGDNV